MFTRSGFAADLPCVAIGTERQLEFVTRTLERDPWKPKYPFPSAHARRRDAAATARIQDALAKADTTNSPALRERWIGVAFASARSRQYARTFPRDLWIRSCAVAVIILPWTLLGRAGYGTVGVIASAVVAVGLWTARRALRRPEPL